MPTGRYSPAIKPTFSEVKLELPTPKSKDIVKKRRRPSKNAPKAAFCAKSKGGATLVRIQPSVQAFSFPDNVSEERVTVPYNIGAEVAHTIKIASKLRQGDAKIKTSHASEDAGSTSTDHLFLNYVYTTRKERLCHKPIELTPSTSTIEPIARESVLKKMPSSAEMIDSHHKPSVKKMNFKSMEWKRPCAGSVNVGAPKPYIGNCPPTMDQNTKMSTAGQKFFLTQDPRKKSCLRNPDALRMKGYSGEKAFNTVTTMVKQADNICAQSQSETSESFICEIVDMENPMDLDFQGLDYQKTYEHDEQDIQNQRLFRQIQREMARKRVKKQTGENVEAQLQQERLAVPSCFSVVDRNEVIPPAPSEESIRYGKIFRPADKPLNKQQLAQEWVRRNARYKNLYLTRKTKNEKALEEIDRRKAEEAQIRAATIVKQDFDEMAKNINEAIQRSLKKQVEIKRPEVKRRTFPHTLRETKQFKRKLETQNRIKRDEAKVKQEFFMERLGKKKVYREADLKLSESPRHSSDKTLSEQSTDDEDDIKVGQSTDVFKLRGFHFRLGSELRGKAHERQQPHNKREKGCKTREEWLNEIIPTREPIKVDIEVGIQKYRSPDDPNLDLLAPKFNYKAPKPQHSTVQQYVRRRLGRHYDRVLRKRLKIAAPRLQYSVKKFNLINFMFGDIERMRVLTRVTEHDVDKMEKSKRNANNEPKNAMDFVLRRERLAKEQHELAKKKRMMLLGIPCDVKRKSSLTTICEHSDTSSDAGWVPVNEPDLESIHSGQVKQTVQRISTKERGNMPAPEFRETTLRCHPRHPRPYAALRVPSQLFDEAVQNTGIPHMHKLETDKLNYANVQLKKTEYTAKFDARHHHDHWDATQRKMVNVHFQPKIAKPTITKVKRHSDEKKATSKFHMANPPCNAFVQMDITMPTVDLDGMMSQHKSKCKRKIKVNDESIAEDECHASDVIYHSRPAEDLANLDYPGRKEFLQLCKDLRNALYDSGMKEEHYMIDREALIKELEEDLKSINSCLTSVSSSECTNLSNDSGSFLLVEGKTKIPLDYIRKSVVPFEELQRARFKIEPIDVEAEDANPFRSLPFAGQKKEQEMKTAKDSFFTFNTRLQNGLRLRLEVPVEDVRKKLIGRGKNKFPSLVATDIDPNYVNQLKNRASIKTFNFKSGSSILKDALRMKFESLLIQGQIVRTKIYDRLNDQYWENLMHTKMLFEKLFDKWEKREYQAAMRVVYQVKSYFDTTDVLKRDFRVLDRKYTLLNMDIVFTEGIWIQRVMLQNFHYLLADADWRMEHDWIHREHEDSEELESFELSIAKRSKVNVRQRDKDDAWAIKTYYEDVYLKNQHPLLFVFKDADAFLEGVSSLKSRTFVLLLELHYVLNIHTEMQGHLETYEEWCANDLLEKEKYVLRKSAKKFFMADRMLELKAHAMYTMGEPFDNSFNNDQYHQDRAVIAEVWRRIVPSNLRGSSDCEPDAITQVAMLSTVVIELLAKFETIPDEESRRIEANLRRRRAYQMKVSQQAYQVEKRIEREMHRLKKNLEPPFKKPKRLGKLPRVLIKKKIVEKKEEEEHISEHTKFFIRAFYEEGINVKIDKNESSFAVENIQEQIVPFYFDHFLKLNGYTPNYNFKTNVELRDGPESDRVTLRHLLPEVNNRLEAWELLHKKIRDENIAKNPKMYVNVKF